VARAEVSRYLTVPIAEVAWWPMAAAHAVALVTAWMLFEGPRRAWQYIPAGAFVGITIAVVVLVPFLADVRNQWLSGWIVVSAPVGLLVLARFPRATCAAVLPVLALFVYWKLDQVERVYWLSYQEGDFVRFRLWEDAVKLTFERPLLGVGPGNYLDYNMRYGQLGVMFSSPHGNYQQIAAEMGFVGLGFLLWLAVRVVALGLRLYRDASDALVRSVAIAATCSLAAQLSAAVLGDFLIPSYHNGGYSSIGATVYAWVMIGVLLVLERIENRTGLSELDGAGAGS